MSVGFPEQGDIFVDKYSVKSILGSGGFSRIYHALQVDLDRDVALKIMREDLSSDPAFRERFYREAKAASRLDHPNSVRVLEFRPSEATTRSYCCA